MRTRAPLLLIALCWIALLAAFTARSTGGGDGYRLRVSVLHIGSAAQGGRFELLEDERLTGAVRPLVVRAHGEDPCDSAVTSVYPEVCSSLNRLPLRPAIVRLVDSRGVELDRVVLERATAGMSRLAVSLHDTVIAVTVDLSAGFGSYSGRVVRFLDARSNRVAWTQVIDDSTGLAADLALATTLKTAWRLTAGATRPEILLVACRPNFEHNASNNLDSAFVVTYSRLYVAAGLWRRVTRRTVGFWEDEGRFPARSKFP